MFIKIALITCFSARILASAYPDISDLLHRAQEADDANAKIERNYVFQQRTETRLGKTTQIETYDTILSGGRPYQRLIARNDKPLSPAEDKKEEAKALKHAPADDEEKRRKNRELAHETLKAFDFAITGEDADNWILTANPHLGYRSINRETSVLRHFKGRMWISKTDLIWTRLDAEAIDNISYALVIARLNKGSHLVIERTKINGEVWLPKRISGGGAGRIALLKKLEIQFETTCSRYRKFSAESRLISDAPAK